MRTGARLAVGAVAAATIANLLALGTAPAADAGIPCTITAGGWCGYIRHYSPDDGLDSAIKIRCNFGDPSSEHWLAEGQNSDRYCKDTDQVYVGAGEEIWCKYPNGPNYDPTSSYVWLMAWDSDGHAMDATGWHKINDIWDDGAGCTKRAD